MSRKNTGGPNVFPPREIQELLGGRRTFAYGLLTRGGIPSYNVGKLRRVKLYDFERWLEDNKYPSAEQPVDTEVVLVPSRAGLSSMSHAPAGSSSPTSRREVHEQPGGPAYSGGLRPGSRGPGSLPAAPEVSSGPFVGPGHHPGNHPGHHPGHHPDPPRTSGRRVGPCGAPLGPAADLFTIVSVVIEIGGNLAMIASDASTSGGLSPSSLILRCQGTSEATRSRDETK